MSRFVIACWVIGFILLLTNDVSDVHQSFRSMWGHRLVAFGSMANFCFFFMFSEGHALGYVIGVLNVVIFIHHAVQEYGVRKVFNTQYREWIKENMK